MRIYDIEKVIEDGYHVVKLKNPPAGNAEDFNDKLKLIEKWADTHCEGDYVILLESVIINKESDALIFKLRYG